MIARLSGKIVDVRRGRIVLQVGGVGYLVAVRNPLGFLLGEETSLHTHLAVRETAMDLYGFKTQDELEMFEHLLKLPKIGPKSAMQILTQADIELLKKAVLEGDATYLSKMSGIGKKSAEKIVIGLKDTLDVGTEYESTLHEGDSDVVDALIALGYSHKDARDALQKIGGTAGPTNERLREALKQLGT